jgi:hypothetical protein
MKIRIELTDEDIQTLEYWYSWTDGEGKTSERDDELLDRIHQHWKIAAMIDQSINGLDTSELER